MTPGSPLHEILGGGRPEAAGGKITLYIVRHGATKLNNQTDTSVDRIRGWSDVPLVEEGREEARRAAAKLKGKGVEAIICSDLSRARETAGIIGDILGIKPEPSFELRPWNVGKLTGVCTKDALPQLAEYVRNKPDTPVPEGETFNQFKARGFKGFADAVAAHPGKIVCIVTHHRLERLIEAWKVAGQPPDHSLDLNTFLQKGDPPGGVELFETTEAALKGNGSMMRSGKPIGTDENPGLGPAERFKQKWAETGKMPAPISMAGPDSGQPELPSPIPSGIGSAGNATAMAHGRAIAGAKALHAVGHISEVARDKHIAKSQKAIAGRKPFGAFAPSGPGPEAA